MNGKFLSPSVSIEKKAEGNKPIEFLKSFTEENTKIDEFFTLNCKITKK